MNIGIFGDLHGNFDKLISALPFFNVILCVGDLGYYKTEQYIHKVTKEKNEIPVINDELLSKINKLVITVPGNNDDNEFLDDHYDNGIYTDHNITFLHGNFFQLDDHLWVYGFGKIYIPNTFYSITKQELHEYGFLNNREILYSMIKKRGHVLKEEFNLAVNNILEFNKNRNYNKDQIIFISHDSPKIYYDKYKTTCGSILIDHLIYILDPTISFFGHYHTHVDIPNIGSVLNKEELYIYNI